MPRQKKRKVIGSCTEYGYYSHHLRRIVRKPTARLYEILEQTYSLRSEVEDLSELIDDDFVKRVSNRCELFPDDVRYVYTIQSTNIGCCTPIQLLYQFYSLLSTTKFSLSEKGSKKNMISNRLSQVFQKIILADAFRMKRPIYCLHDTSVHTVLIDGMKVLPNADWKFLLKLCLFSSADDITKLTNLPQDAMYVVKEYMYGDGGGHSALVDVDSIWFILETICNYSHSPLLYNRVHDLINSHVQVMKIKGLNNRTVLECLIKNWSINSSAINVWEPIMKIIRGAIVACPKFMTEQVTDKWDKKESLFQYFLPIVFEQGIRYGPNAKNILLDIIMLTSKLCPETQRALDSNGNTALHLFTQAFTDFLSEHTMDTSGFKFCSSIVKCFPKDVWSIKNGDELTPRDIALTTLPGRLEEISYIFSDLKSDHFNVWVANL